MSIVSFDKEREMKLFKQWEYFQKGLPLNKNILQAWILKSWERSRQYEVDPYNQIIIKVSNDNFQRRLQKNADLLRCATGMVNKLIKSVENTHSVISLADSDAVILYADYRSEGQTLFPTHSLRHIALEKYFGTNAIGTCIHEKRPIQLIGAEHYCASDHVWYCAAAPIFYPKNVLIGVLNISISKEHFHRHTNGMVEAAAYAITEQLQLLELLRNQSITMELLDEGIISLDQYGNVSSISPKALRMLHLKEDCLGQDFLAMVVEDELFKSVLDDNINIYDQEMALKDNPQTSYVFSAISNQHGGAILTIREYKRLRELTRRTIGAKAKYSFDNILGNSQAIRHAKEQGKIVAQSDINTLLLGESGTGKELFAQAIHNASKRAREPFVVVNCGAIPRDLIFAELFGYSDGAFTGARSGGKIGKFELADGGTIFLDEIGEMPLETQVTLLRLLQNQEVSRLGSKTVRYVNVRILAATNKDLFEAIEQKEFRQDLFYRLNAFSLTLPSLRERKEDVELLARHFLKKFAKNLNKKINDFTPNTLRILTEYKWPGNIRELENTIERAVNITKSTYIEIEDLPKRMQEDLPEHTHTQSLQKESDTFKQQFLKTQECTHICHVLEEVGGNMRQAALSLGISRSTLYAKLEKYNIECKKYREKSR